MTTQPPDPIVAAGSRPDALDVLAADLALIADRSAALPVEMARMIVIAALRYIAAEKSYRAENGCTAGPLSSEFSRLFDASYDALIWLRDHRDKPD